MTLRSRFGRAMAASSLVWLASCAAFTERSDYLDYRAVRLERDADARLLAEERYTTRHPHGHWYEEVHDQHRARDHATFEAGKSTRAGLELYLAAFPDGQFAAQAKSRLAAVAVIERRQREEAQNAARLAEARTREEAELNRTWVTRFFGFWVKSLLSIEQWGASIEQVARANPEFSRAFGRAPRPRCTVDECVKYYESAYAVPVPGGTRLERSVSLILRLRMEHGVLIRAELLLPGRGFSRWREIEERVPVVDGDPDARKQAVDWAFARIAPLLDTLAPHRVPIANYTLAAIVPPAIGSSGELVDTTALDPSAPANRIQGQGEPGSAVAAKPEASVEELVKPEAPEQAPDMELGPLRVGKDGRPLRPTPNPTPAPTKPAAPVPEALAPADEEPILEMAPLPVPAGSAAQPATKPAPPAATPPATQPDAGAPAAPPLPSAGAITRAFESTGLRLVFYAAASDAKPPAYDALVIEKISTTPAARAGAKPSSGAAAHPKRREGPAAPKAGAAAAPAGAGH